MTYHDDEGRDPSLEGPDDSLWSSAGSPYLSTEYEILLRRVAEIVAGARPMPLSASVMINKEEVLELLEEAIARLPEELRAARWLLKQREQFLAKARREGEDIIDEARARAERMVQRTEVVKAAEVRARQILERADERARRLRMEAEDFVDQKLASFEIVLERTLKMVSAGRSKLQGSPITGETNRVPPPGVDGDPSAPDPGNGAPQRSTKPFYDQDH